MKRFLAWLNEPVEISRVAQLGGGIAAIIVNLQLLSALLRLVLP
jgi:hypothetical protein